MSGCLVSRATRHAFCPIPHGQGQAACRAAHFAPAFGMIIGRNQEKLEP
jgi:hypothetical protein